jgi:16S rRNA U1498 N3-methylase RsmE
MDTTTTATTSMRGYRRRKIVIVTPEKGLDLHGNIFSCGYSLDTLGQRTLRTETTAQATKAHICGK